ncbi:MAG: transglutaminase-like domain-containing protein [Candidatus Faecimonas sp.]|nr:transglutaminase-like domain-containing protein [Mycoplasmatota bacterium]MDY2908788.1 transglutaminase-like domain-containing protein [Candidatus Faecimonas sp.]
MKKSLVILGIAFIIIGVLFSYQEDLQKIYYQVLRRFTQGELVLKKNQYYRDYDFDFVQNTDKLEPTNRQELLNTFYTIINSGEEEFTFYCPDSYSSCLDEVEQIANDQDLLSHINNFVHPYNGFNHIETQYDSLGKVTVYIKKSYSKKQIQELESKIDELSQELILPGDSDINNIRRVHDYIINHSIYDSNRSDYNITTYNSDIAYGPLFQGYGICGGYTDAMELFLEEMGIKSYKISSDQHVWNAVYLDGKWVHLDLTWDDPVVSSGENLLEHNFFLIDTSTLLALEQTEHIFDQNIYSELKEV